MYSERQISSDKRGREGLLLISLPQACWSFPCSAAAWLTNRNKRAWEGIPSKTSHFSHMKAVRVLQEYKQVPRLKAIMLRFKENREFSLTDFEKQNWENICGFQSFTFHGGKSIVCWHLQFSVDARVPSTTAILLRPHVIWLNSSFKSFLVILLFLQRHTSIHNTPQQYLLSVYHFFVVD